MSEKYPQEPCNPVVEAINEVANTCGRQRAVEPLGAAALHKEIASGRADPPTPKDVDFTQRPSYLGEYRFDQHGAPINPRGPLGKPGRGELWKWGPNSAADPVVVAIDPNTRQRKVLLIRREDTGTWALPGGHVDPGEHVSRTAVRELQEEAGIDLAHLEGEVVYEGYVDDPRNTDNAWFETSARLFRLEHTPQPRAGDDAVEAQWFNCNTLSELQDAIREMDQLDIAVNPIYASHGDIISEALDRLSADGE